MTGAESTASASDGGFTDAPRATSLFVGGWVAAALASVVTLAILGYADNTVDRPVAVLGAALAAAWAAELIATAIASKRAGSGDVIADLGFSFAPIDLVGIPIGIAAQVGLLRLVYLPLEAIWPDAFSREKLEQNALDLIDGVTGAALALLFVLVVVGAPLVEEIFYRGLLQRPWLGRFGSLGPFGSVVVVVAVAAVFALIHFRPVEYPGLFAFGLVVGAMAARTGRIGMSVITHVAFNATALLLVV